MHEDYVEKSTKGSGINLAMVGSKHCSLFICLFCMAHQATEWQKKFFKQYKQLE